MEQRTRKRKTTVAHFILAFMACYISGYVIVNITGNLNAKNVFLQIYGFIVFSGIFAYGLISLINDVKSGGISLVIEKVRKFINE